MHNQNSVPWLTMLRYFFLTIPLFIISIVVFLKRQAIPYHYVLWFFLGVIILTGVVNYSKLSKVLRLIVLYIILGTVTEVIAKYFAIEYRDNSPVFHFFIPIQIIFFGIIYSKLLLIRKTNWVYWGSLTLALTVSIVNSLFSESIWGLFPSINFISLGVFVLPLSLLYFKSMVLNPTTVNLENQPYFWLNIGTFVFFTLNFFILGFHASLKLEVPSWIYDILWGANLAFYIAYFIAIILDSKRKIKP